MNQSLQYAKTSFKGFVNNDEWMNDSLSTFSNTQTLTKDDVFAMANKCRNGATPVFADDKKFLTTNAVSGDAGAVVVTEVSSIPQTTPIATTTNTQTTQPIQNQISQLSSQLTPNEKLILEGVAIGIGIAILFKMLA